LYFAALIASAFHSANDSRFLFALCYALKVKSSKNATIESESDDVVLDVAEEPAFSLKIERIIGKFFYLAFLPRVLKYWNECPKME